MDDTSPRSGADAGSNASDFQPPTQNPQADVGGVQSTQNLQGGTQGITQDELVDPRPLTVQTDRSSTTLVPVKDSPQLTEARTAGVITGIILVIIIGIVLIMINRRRHGHKMPDVFPELPVNEAVTAGRPKKKAKPTKSRVRKKTRTKR